MGNLMCGKRTKYLSVKRVISVICDKLLSDKKLGTSKLIYAMVQSNSLFLTLNHLLNKSLVLPIFVSSGSY